MECKVYEFAKIDKKEKRNLRKAYYWKQWFDILISYIFILISSSKPFFRLKMAHFGWWHGIHFHYYYRVIHM